MLHICGMSFINKKNDKIHLKVIKTINKTVYKMIEILFPSIITYRR